MTRAQIKLKPGKDKALKNFHPWIFSGALAHSGDAGVGDELDIISHEGDALAVGHYCGPQGLSVRVCSFSGKAVLDENFWRQKFLSAWALRQALGFPLEHTNAFRLIHGEGDGLSGLVCDIFADSASIGLSNPGLVRHMPLFTDFLQRIMGINNIYYHEDQEAQVSFYENGLRFEAQIGAGQKTGHFLDQRDNREFARSLAAGRHVLDAFCYSGAFSVYARAGKALSVTSVDISASALAQVKKHMAFNDDLAGTHEMVQADCFAYLRTLKPYEKDFIILDPPAFAKNKESIIKASRGYKDIAMHALKALAPRSFLLSFSCSQHITMDLFKKIIFAAAKDSGRDVKIIRELGQGADHPVSIYCPQSSYLKGLALYVA